MTVIHDLGAFGLTTLPPEPPLPDYCYQGRCPQTGLVLRLPRTALAAAIAQGLMGQLQAEDPPELEGKMYGVLVVTTAQGQWGVLKAFSGLRRGQAVQPGWVPPIPGRSAVAGSEAETLAALERLKQELAAIDDHPAWDQEAALVQSFGAERQALAEGHRRDKLQRHQHRHQLQATLQGSALTTALAQLDRQSQGEKGDRRRLKHQQDQALAPVQAQTAALADRRQTLRQERKRLSRRLQQQLHATYALTNFAGLSQSLAAIVQGQGIPTGTGDCCAPKLLHAAATLGLRPRGLAEFWWGPATGGRRSGQFYGACGDRCQPIMGFLLSGLEVDGDRPDRQARGEIHRLDRLSLDPLSLDRLSLDRLSLDRLSLAAPTSAAPTSAAPTSAALRLGHDIAQDLGENPSDSERDSLENSDLERLYDDHWLLVINKPAGLLSLPGRTCWDSVLSRLRCQEPDALDLRTVHRLDQATSGLLLLARDRVTHRALSQQFQQRQVQKTYGALLSGLLPGLLPGLLDPREGLIDLPLGSSATDRPRQRVDFSQGKASQTRFRLLGQTQGYSRVEFQPLTGRTHQLRVHAADPRGLGLPILGDRLYGSGEYGSGEYGSGQYGSGEYGSGEYGSGQTAVGRGQDWPGGDRLHLHSQGLTFIHPHTGEAIVLHCPTPF
ncbi:RluA family pseudouridine synthase [Prochlorothrix hollandica]|uniref:RluA family pseudouridine synthase n=1 Tax=Prochlorothrix hollandica TaxID=1223 RepID=UPI000347491F|nr:RluA family pseudouridine synthase [Prochlorothrix hollandica]